MGNQPDNEKHSKQEVIDLTFEKRDYEPGEVSRRILKKWREGVIICRWPSFFHNEDDIEME